MHAHIYKHIHAYNVCIYIDIMIYREYIENTSSFVISNNKFKFWKIQDLNTFKNTFFREMPMHYYWRQIAKKLITIVCDESLHIDMPFMLWKFLFWKYILIELFYKS